MKIVAATGLVLLTLISYRSVWTAAWVYEDAAAMNYSTRTLTYQTWRVVRSPLGSHLLSLSLFFLLSAAILVLAHRLGVRGSGIWVIAVLWLLHPINVESVAYAASRGELLAALFIVAACILATYDWWYTGVGIVACVIAAALSKESGIVGLVLVSIIMAYFRYPVWQGPVIIATGILCIGVIDYGGLRTVANIGTTSFVSASAVSWVDWAGIQAAAARHWLVAIVWLQGLTPDPDIDIVSAPGRWISAGILASMGGIAWLIHHRLPVAALGLSWFLLALLPRFVVQTPQSYLSAHHMLVPFIGLALTAGALFEERICNQ